MTSIKILIYELFMVVYAKDKLVGITELGKKLAIVRRNKPEAVIITIVEYEKIKSVKFENFKEIEDNNAHIKEIK